MTPPPSRLVTPRLNSSIVFQTARQVLVPSLSVYWSGCVMPMSIPFLRTTSAVRRNASAASPWSGSP